MVSVGNLTVGGSGKTPFVAYLASRFFEAGWKVAIASRGYGGKPGRTPLLVSAGRGPLVTAAEGGDEPVLLAHLMPFLIVTVGPNRTMAARMAVERCGAQIILLDDGFQHRRLARDLDLVLVNAKEGFGNGKMLPLGPLREPPQAVQRAQAVVLTGTAQELSRGEALLDFWQRRLASKVPVFFCERCVKGFVRLPGGEPIEASALQQRRALVFSGIAHPEAFEADLGSLGIEIVSRFRYRDHQVLGSSEIKQIENRTRLAKPDFLITTEKDGIRLGNVEFSVPVYALRIHLVPRAEESLWTLVSNRIPSPPDTVGVDASST